MNRNYLLTLLVIWFLSGEIAQAKSAKKEIFIPAKSLKENKFNQLDGQFSYDYMAESENLVLFWAKSFGKDPMNYADKSRRFNPEEILREGERFYNYYRDKLKFVDKKKSYSSRYKMIIWMYNDDNTTAYGWGDEGVGMMWMRPCRTQSYPYCPLAHEMGHSFQYMVGADGARSFSGCPLVEYTSQWMLWQVYSDWTTIEQFHLDAYMDQTHYSLLNEVNMYHAPQFMEYWSNKHGLDIIARIWREAEGKEDPVSAYKRLTGISQQQFNDEIYEAATRFVTWDIPRIKTVCSSYANQHRCKLDAVGEGWYRIAQTRCPQNYGYNAIRLNVPEGGTMIDLDFEGLAGNKDFRSVKVDKAGWRYGFVAVCKNGQCVYGDRYESGNGMNRTVRFEIPENTQFLWLVVTGAPVEHWDYMKTWSVLKNEKGKEAQWPYQIRLKGTSIHSSVLKAKK
ncbi:DUF6055 domain-containing protein [uncultured Bacteroides sp.]|jgi:hypothetical protein|uniref:DUF6055 domain-containing protein n=1 Tax=uncultured Bacteroides sp. TaxID=162156 RepID=UPI000821FC14|nr:DUF6055 domain-containing protein [uncultured Bacteroides sp.]SCI09326.1 Uncharacterised protein [uncultured Bacteroides sp.]